MLGQLSIGNLSAQTATYIWNGSTSGTWQTGTDQANWDGGAYSPGNGGGNAFQFAASTNTRTTINLAGGHNPNVNNLLINGNTPLLTIAINGAVANTKLDLTALSDGATTITVTGGATTIETLGTGGAGNAGTVELQSFNNHTWDIQGTATLTINSPIRGSGTARGFTKIGTGTLVLGGENLYTGKTAINGGTLRIDDELRLGPNPGSFAADHFRLNDATLQTTASFAIDDANRGITLGPLGGSFRPDPSTSLTITKVITGTGALTKTGDGSLILGAANTYTGNTFVSSGELIITNTTGSGTGAGSVQVNAGALRGTGILAPAAGGALTIASGALVSVGLTTDVSGKILTVGSSGKATTLTLQTGSILEFDLFSGAGQGNNTAALSSADLLRWAGALNVENGVTVKINNPNGMTGFAANDTWRLFDWATLGGGAPSGSFALLLADLPSLGSGLSWDLSHLYTNGTITIVVPEPGRSLLALTGLSVLVLRRNRRR